MNNPLPKTKREATRLGVSRYFTGKPCKYGHTVDRYTVGGHCVDCQAAKAAERYKDNKDAIKAYQKEWYQRSGWYEKNKVEIKIRRILKSL